MSASLSDATIPFDAAALERWLVSHVDGFAGPLKISRFKVGQSNPSYLLETPSARYVMRTKPAPAAKLLPSAHAIDREFRVQSALFGSDVPVAKMYRLCEDESIIGRAFYIMDFVEGRIFWEQSLPGVPADERLAIYVELNRVIAALHGLDVAALGLDDYGKAGNYFVRQVDRWTRQYRACELQRIDAMERLIEWLPANIPTEEAPQVSLVHGDFRIDNVIFHPTEPRILAVIDWELSTLGHPLADFAYHLMSWHMPQGALRGLRDLDLATLGIPDEATYIAMYRERTGAAEADWNYYLAYNVFRLAAIVQGIAKRASEGIASNSTGNEHAQYVEPLAELAWSFACKLPFDKGSTAHVRHV
jgi:aminoglycoside phosphotransferase (APT) family kinase protein